ncbi:MAG: hypothetical protein HC763_28650 [Hydrococcus sp. CRU_1_1]|nr:hypothetical protein [Hydrococcus sp. CRU_1_1]
MISEPSDRNVTFYTISDARYFPGVVALLNSLRLTGHQHRLVILDCGLTPNQRESLQTHCTLFEMPKVLASNPTLFKPFPNLLNPTGTVVIIDSDMIVTRSLQNIIDLAQQGKICAFPDPECDRYFEEWQTLFDLPNKPRRQTYVNAGLLAFSTEYWPDLLPKWWQACHKILSHPTIAEGVADNPSAQADQDALNALLMSEIPPDAIALQPKDGEVFRRRFQQVRVTNRQTLAATYRGQDTTILHCCDSPKPWHDRAWRKIRADDAYIYLMRRLLSERDVTVKVKAKQVPIWLRGGILGQLAFHGLDRLNGAILVAKSQVRRLIQRGFRPPSPLTPLVPPLAKGDEGVKVPQDWGI